MTDSNEKSRLDWARREARNGAINKLHEQAYTGLFDEASRKAWDSMSSDEQAHFLEAKKLPDDFEFSHLYSASYYPEIANDPSTGYLTSYLDHRYGDHGGDTIIPLHGSAREPDWRDTWGTQEVDATTPEGRKYLGLTEDVVDDLDGAADDSVDEGVSDGLENVGDSLEDISDGLEDVVDDSVDEGVSDSLENVDDSLEDVSDGLEDISDGLEDVVDDSVDEDIDDTEEGSFNDEHSITELELSQSVNDQIQGEVAEGLEQAPSLDSFSDDSSGEQNTDTSWNSELSFSENLQSYTENSPEEESSGETTSESVGENDTDSSNLGGQDDTGGDDSSWDGSLTFSENLSSYRETESEKVANVSAEADMLSPDINQEKNERDG